MFVGMGDYVRHYAAAHEEYAFLFHFHEENYNYGSHRYLGIYYINEDTEDMYCRQSVIISEVDKQGSNKFVGGNGIQNDLGARRFVR